VTVALLILAHGSPCKEANEDVLRVALAVRARGLFGRVEAAFLECAEPSIPRAIDDAVAAGATCIVAVPYFLHTGVHVCEDLPALLEAAQERHPGVEFLLGPFVGRSSHVTEILVKRARSALAAETPIGKSRA
jgi:sirohydrochlorin ferrochelatase